MYFHLDEPSIRRNFYFIRIFLGINEEGKIRIIFSKQNSSTSMKFSSSNAILAIHGTGNQLHLHLVIHSFIYLTRVRQKNTSAV